MKIHEIGDQYAYLRPHMMVIPNGTTVWLPSRIHPDADVGIGCMIGAFTNICAPVTIGDRTRIQGCCYIPEGVQIGSDVFIGPNVTFTNVKWPAVRGAKDDKPEYLPTIIGNGVAIGAGVVILPGVHVFPGAVIGAGSVVTKHVGPDCLVYGNPAKHIRGLR